MQRSALLSTRLDARVRAAWQSQLAAAARRPGLLRELVRRRQEILPRFAANLAELQRLPRPLRRAAMRRFATSLAGIALGLALGAAPSAAATIDVQGGCTLADAITAANTDSPAGACGAGSGEDTIVLAPGSTLSFSSGQEFGYGPTALPTITSQIVIEGNGSTLRRVPDEADSPFRLLAIGDEGDLALRDTTITGGRLTEGDGGGISSYFGFLRLTRCTVSGNAAEYGGGLANYGGWVTVEASAFADNQAAEAGGGIFTDGGSTFLQYSSVTGNAAPDAGGVGAETSALTLYGSTIADNAANGAEGYGGGIATYRGSLAIQKSTIAGNTATGGGGGVANYMTPTLLDASTVSGNASVNFGGGVDNFESDITIWNSTISGNTSAHGAGVSNVGDAATLLVRLATIVRNDALETGGGVYATSPFLLGRTIVSGNTALLGGAEVDSAPGNTLYVGDFNVFGHDGDAGVAGFAPGASDLVPGQPLAGIVAPALADNGGPTLTLALIAGSPAIDAAPADDFCFPTDQRGVARPQGAACDVGAFEGLGGGAVAEICGNCVDDDGDGAIDLADPDCAAAPLASEKATLSLRPAPASDQITLTATFPKGPAFNPRLEGATVSFADAAGQIACVRIPAQTAAAPKAWKERTTRAGTTWTFKDAKDGSLGGPTKDSFSAQCSSKKSTCTVKLRVRAADLAGDGSARPITTGVVIGDDAWKKEQPFRSKAKGKTLVTP